MKKSILFLSVILLSFLLISTSSFAQDPGQSLIDASRITSWVSGNGFHDWLVDNQEYNGSYPNGKPAGVIFSEGINWGGMVYDGQSQLIRVNGNNYASGCKALSRPFRVRTDYASADLSNDAANFYRKDPKDVTGSDLALLKAQYQTDWDEWPAGKGAPYYDTDKDGTYDPNVDIPGVPGALQTLWIKYRDDGSLRLYDSDPIGLNITETYWVYGRNGRISNIIYKKVDIIYSGTTNTPPDSHIDSMYICQWADTDLGNGTDDFIGTDTTLNLGYTYNSSDYDRVYSGLGLVPPAVGHTFLQGVSHYTGSSSDSAVFNFRWVKGRKYFNHKPLTNSILKRTAGCFSDPYYAYTGTLEFYNLMSGYKPDPPYPSRDTGCEFIGFGTYMLPGDPVTGTGLIDGILDPPGSRRYWLMNGPFNMTLGDTAEIVEALVVGTGEDHLGSITEMKHIAAGAIEFYNAFVKEMTSGTIEITSPGETHNQYTPSYYKLYQNYPNPFNSFTTFRYQLPEAAFVTLTIYDVLGREVTKLVHEQKEAGEYTVKFDAGSLSSGIYLYRITFDNEYNKQVFDALNKTMKFILLK